MVDPFTVGAVATALTDDPGRDLYPTWQPPEEDGSLWGLDLLPGLEGLFTWEAEAESYGGSLESYRWGWDVTDPDDPNDPNWALPPGLSEAQKTLTQGSHFAIPFWGWDFAGFSGEIPTAELYLRATAMATFCPISSRSRWAATAALFR